MFTNKRTTETRTPAELDRHARASRTRAARNARKNALATTEAAFAKERENFDKLLKASEKLNALL